MNETRTPAAVDAAPDFAVRLRTRVESARARERTDQTQVEAAMRSRLDTVGCPGFADRTTVLASQLEVTGEGLPGH